MCLKGQRLARQPADCALTYLANPLAAFWGVALVSNLSGLENAAGDTEGLWQRLLRERGSVKRHDYRAENRIAYFLNRGRVMVQRDTEKPGSPSPGNAPAGSSTVRHTLNSLSRVA
jgi:hypothetical protein